MSDRRINKTARDLIAAKRLIEAPENWLQGGYGLDGGPVCAVGAVIKSSASQAALDTLNRAARTMAGVDETSAFGASTFNDLNDHTAVMQMFNLAISRALSDSGESA